jgi:copper(I)-binding protein
VKALISSLVLVLLVGGCADTTPLDFEDAKIRLPVPGSDKSVGYFQLTNRSAQDITIIAAEAAGIRTIEFHTMMVVDDMMRMRRLDGFTVPAGESLSFESGGKHLMLFGVGELGDQVELVFRSDTGVEYRQPFTTYALKEQR